VRDEDRKCGGEEIERNKKRCGEAMEKRPIFFTENLPGGEVEPSTCGSRCKY